MKNSEVEPLEFDANHPDEARTDRASLGGRLLLTAGMISFGIALLHVLIVLLGPRAYRFFGAGEQLAAQAEAGSPGPALLTLMLAIVFALFGLIALSGAGSVRPIPLSRWLLSVIGAAFTLRGLLLIQECARLARQPDSVPARALIFSAVSLATGVLYLLGVALSWRRIGRRTFE